MNSGRFNQRYCLGGSDGFVGASSISTSNAWPVPLFATDVETFHCFSTSGQVDDHGFEAVFVTPLLRVTESLGEA